MDNLDLAAALRQHFGFHSFRLGQRAAIEHALARRDALVVMPTGSGKSLCYQLPALLLDGTTLVISPLIALMKDQVDALVAANKRATFINSTLAPGEQRERIARLARGDYKIVYVAPERLRNSDFLRALANVRVALLAVDEAHCISQWGHDFRPDYMYLRDFIPHIGKPPVFALTATATPEVQNDILKQLGLAQAERIVTGFNRPNLSFTVRYAPSEPEKLRGLKALLSDPHCAGIIYTGTRREAEEVAEFVNDVAHVRAAHYHAGLDDDERTRAQDAFMRDETPVIVATNAFGMGVDKANIRFVIHYNLPATVEAYYQEIGRAGRDGRPARGVLLYSPQDRALQEWFIENDAPTRAEVENLYRLLPRGTHLVSPLDLQRQTGLIDSKLKIALRQLENAGALRRLGDERGTMLVQVIALARLDLSASAAEIERFRERKRQKLAQMIRYAETDGCRRRFILDYFGDRGPADAPDCCDNHHALTPARPAETEDESVALTILDCVRVVSNHIGRLGVSKILAGSRSQDVARFQRNPFYGRLAHFKQSQLDDLVNELIAKGYIKIVGGDYPVVALSPLGASAIKTRAAIALRLPQTTRNAETARGERDLGTVEYTHQLFGQGLSPDAIAQQRGLKTSTVYDHLAQLIAQGLVHVDAVIAPELQAQVRQAMGKAESLNLSAIKALLPETISYDMIRCVRAAHDLEQQGPAPLKPTADEELAPLTPEEQVIFDALRALRTQLASAEQLPPYVIFHDRTLRGLARQRPQTPAEFSAVFGIGASKTAKYGERVLAILRQYPRKQPDDAVAEFLSTARPKPLRGPWRSGFALDFNSKFAGARWERTELGELVYRFKYAGDRTVAETLATRLGDLIRTRPDLHADVIVPIPSTKKDRPYDPVPLLARALGNQIAVAVHETALVKARATELQKAMTNVVQKQANMKGAFHVADAGAVRGKQILLLDDFYDSGATLGEATRVLLAAGAASVNVLTVTKTIHAD
ncbi:MAG: RecQ family ATP-dependent DNA helicase [Chloroflexi bacterium]|nr:RecQ family ATP-dependent DNA helicase [Chloroflexota bacterium]